MAPTRVVTGRKPQLLSDTHRTLCKLGLIPCLLALLVGTAGLLVVLDVANTDGAPIRWYSNTPFAQTWLRWTEKNAMFTAATFNGGWMVALVLVGKLIDDKAARSEAQAAVAGKKKRK